MTKHHNSYSKDSISLAVLIYPGVVLQDFAGPLEVFSKAKNLSKGKYRTFTVAESLDVVKTENNTVSISPDYTLENMPDADYLIIPGGNMKIVNQLVEDETYNQFIVRWDEKPRAKVVSICTGAYILAGSGLLNGKKATTHFFVADDFSQAFPLVELVRDVRFVEDGRYITSSGITSGIDAALHIVDSLSGRQMRASIARALQHQFHNEEDWPVSPSGGKYSRK
ncbi:MAG: DJ-1/PfpI family protein [Chloroflexota bacterium]